MNPESLTTPGSMAWRPAQKRDYTVPSNMTARRYPNSSEECYRLGSSLHTVAQKEPDLFNKRNADLHDTAFFFFFNQMLMCSP